MKAYLNVIRHIYNNRRKNVIHPVMCTFVVTWKCNLKCSMCGVKRSGEYEMQDEEINEFFRKQMHCLDIVKITGGEPFIRSDLKEIVRNIRNYVNPKAIHITTNGWYTERILDLVEDLGDKRLHIAVSIDGVECSHDEIRGVKGSYQRAMTTLTKLLPYRKRGVKLKVNQTISPGNFQEIRKLKAECSKIGFHNISYMLVNTMPPHSSTIEDKFSDLIDARRFNPYELKSIFKLVSSIRFDISCMLNNYYIHGLRKRLLQNIELPLSDCMSLHAHFRLFPNGDIVTCIFDATPVGNIRENSVNDIWFGEKAASRRELIKRCKQCWTGCEIIPSAVYSGDFLWRFLKWL